MFPLQINAYISDFFEHGFQFAVNGFFFIFAIVSLLVKNILLWIINKIFYVNKKGRFLSNNVTDFNDIFVTSGC